MNHHPQTTARSKKSSSSCSSFLNKGLFLGALIGAGLVWVAQVRLLEQEDHQHRHNYQHYHRRGRAGPHVNFFATKQKRRQKSNKNSDKNNGDRIHTEHGVFEVASSGMLRRVKEDDQEDGEHKKKNPQNPPKPKSIIAQRDRSVTALERLRQERQPPKGSGYAPTGGPLPKLANAAVHGPQAVSAAGRADNFTCLYEQDHHDNAQQQQQPLSRERTQALLPRVIVLGTMKGGTQALTHYLWQHPHFCAKDKGMEIHFFNNYDFHSTHEGIPVELNQQRYALRYQKSHSCLFVQQPQPASLDDPAIAAAKSQRNQQPQQPLEEQPLKQPTPWTLDSTPYYLMGTDRIPQAISCIAPNAKLIVLLRNPIERAASHYRYLNQARHTNHKPMVDWDVWIRHDISLLRDAGVLRDNDDDKDNGTFAGSDEEYQAWSRYLNNRHNSQHIVGRGLYVIQLEHYYKVLQRGHYASSDKQPQPHHPNLLVLRSEQLRHQTHEVFAQVLDFLQLPQTPLPDASARHETNLVHPEARGVPMPPEIRRELQELYRPYNQRLFRLLNWTSNVWEGDEEEQVTASS